MALGPDKTSLWGESDAVNYISFLNAISTRSKYITNQSTISVDHQTKLKNFLRDMYPFSNEHAAITIEDGVKILKILNPNFSPNTSGINLRQVLSKNTAVLLFSYINFEVCSTMSDLFYSESTSWGNIPKINNYNYKEWIFYCIEDTNSSLNLTIYGGGGGGEGGIAGDNGKVDNVVGVSGKGSRGKNTLFYTNDSLYTIASGGINSPQTTVTHNSDGPYSQKGHDGNDGAAYSFSIQVSRTTKLHIVPGKGGNGGGGLALKVNSSGTWYGGNGSSEYGGNGYASNAFSTDDVAMAGAGGGGGGNPGFTNGSYSHVYTGTDQHLRDIGLPMYYFYGSGENPKNGFGGMGGGRTRSQGILNYQYERHTQTGSDKGLGLGAGGYGGYGTYDDDDWASGGGGNGGNSGGLFCNQNYLIFIPR